MLRNGSSKPNKSTKEAYERTYQAQPGKQMRHHFVRKALRRIMESGSPVRQVLDVGCGTAELTQYMLGLAPYISATGIDVSPTRIDAAKMRCPDVTFYISDIESFETQNSYDLITAIDVIEHIGDDQVALAKINRLLRSGGMLLLSTPHSMRYWTRMDETGGHYRRYSKVELRTKLQQAGFNIMSMDTYGFPLPILWLYLKNLLNRFQRFNEQSLIDSRNSFVLRVSSLLKYLLFINVDVGLGLNLLIVAKKVDSV